MFKNVLADLKHYRFHCGNEKQSLLKTLILCLYSNPALLAILLYRFGNWSWNLRLPLIRSICKFIYVLLLPSVRLYSGVHIHPCTKIGKGFVILHFGGVVLCRDCSIGEQCVLHHNFSIVTTNSRQAAHIGNNFYGGTGVVIVGNLIIEDNVICGAGSVVTKSVPSNAIIGGIPAKIFRFRLPDEMPPRYVHGHHEVEPFLTLSEHKKLEK